MPSLSYRWISAYVLIEFSVSDMSTVTPALATLFTSEAGPVTRTWFWSMVICPISYPSATEPLTAGVIVSVPVFSSSMLRLTWLIEPLICVIASLYLFVVSTIGTVLSGVRL